MLRIGYNIDMYLLNPYIYGGAAAFPNEKSLLFDGVDEYVDCGVISSWQSTSNFSYSLWIKPTANPIDAVERVFASYTLSNWVELSINGGAGNIIIQNGTISYGSFPASTFAPNNWYHVVVVYDGTLTGNSNRLKAWVNGVQKTLSFTNNIPATTGTLPGNLEIGTGYTTTDYYKGNIDEFSIYDYSLSSGQVTSLYNSGTPTDLDNTSGVTAPVHWWRMGDGDTYPTITDVGTTGGNNGTMTNQEVGDIVSDVPS